MKKILLVIDEEGWAFHSHAVQIAERLSQEFEFKIVNRKNNVSSLAKEFDCIFVFDPFPLKHGYPPKHITIIRLGCQFLYEKHPDGAEGLYTCGFPGRCVSIQDRCCIFCVVNENQRKIFKSIVGIPLFNTPHGVDEKIFNYDRSYLSNGKKLRIGVAGRDSSNKGFTHVKEVCDQKGFEFSHASYRYCTIKKEDMPTFYRSVDVYVCFSKTEALNNPIMEAGACGIPVVSTRCGAAEEIIDHGRNGLLIERNKQSLAQALEIMQDTHYRRFMGEQMAATIRNGWTWNKRIGSFRDLFHYYFEK